MNPRPYQSGALDALDEHLQTKRNNPCVVLPTGAGKSIVIAWALARWKKAYPPLRALVLAHRSELVSQNAAEMSGVYDGEIGIYSASLDRRDTHCDIIYASIDSIAKRHGEIPPVDIIIIDEAHRIPPKGDGKYRSFISNMRTYNPQMRIVGFTATPYRMGCGPICHKDHILNEICYTAHISDLIADGYLCPLRAKVSLHEPDLSKVRKSQGDYAIAALAAEMDKVVVDAVSEVVEIINKDKRRCVVVFCVNQKHCEHVSACFASHGIVAPMVTGKTSATDRQRTVEDFRAGNHRVLCNINVYTEGFNVKSVDCVVLLRPTLSPGMYAQMVGRGLRLHANKQDCLVLDYGKNIETHGPIDQISGGYVKLVQCRKCREAFSRAVGACPDCGWEIPKREAERLEAEETKRKMHEARAAEVSILSTGEDLLDVDDVFVAYHECKNGPATLRIDYRCGIVVVREFVDLDGKGSKVARAWWAARFGWPDAQEITVSDALADMFLGERIKQKTRALVVTGGKNPRIVEHKLK